MVKLGSTVKDRVTGFVGTVTVRCEYLDGDARCGVSPLSADGALKDHWFDEGRLMVLGEMQPNTVEPAAEPAT